MNSSTPKVYKENSPIFLARENWIPDSKSKACFQCNKEFISLITRRHHCRMCGKVFCAKCSNKFLGDPFVFEEEKKIRVCDYCFKLSQNHIKKISLDLTLQLNPTSSLSNEGSLNSLSAIPEFITYEEQLVEINRNLTGIVQKTSRAILGYILKSKGLYESWGSVLDPLVIQPLFEVQTDPMEEDSSIDINRFIKIKKIPYHDNSQSQLIKGLVLRKNVAHKKMALNFDNPTVLMIASSIDVYDHEDITSINQVIDNEKRQMNQIIELIRKCSPNIVIVEKAVNRIVQQYLLKYNIAVLYKFKPSQFAKIAWATGAKIVTDLRKIENDRDSYLGRCELFKIINHENIECYRKANEQCVGKFNLTNFDPSLLVIQNSKNGNKGVTITISGPQFTELQQVKDCLKLYFRCSRNLVREKEIILQDIFLYHPEKRISKMILWAHENRTSDSDKASKKDWPESPDLIDYTQVFNSSEICMRSDMVASKTASSLFCKSTIESAGYFTRFWSMSSNVLENIAEKQINFTFLERTVMNFEDHIDLMSLNKTELDSLSADFKNNPRGHLDYLTQLCSVPVFLSEKLPSPDEVCLGQFIKKKIELLKSKCEKCGRPGYLHTSFYYREGFFVKISLELTGVRKEALNSKNNMKKSKTEKRGSDKNEIPLPRGSMLSQYNQDEDSKPNGKYFTSLVNFFSSRKSEEDDVKRNPQKQRAPSVAIAINSPINMYLECDVCKKKSSDEFQISKGYLEYSLFRFLDQFIRSGDGVLIQNQVDANEGNETTHAEEKRSTQQKSSVVHQSCCRSSAKSRVFKYQEILFRFSRGHTPVYHLYQTPYDSPRTLKLMKQANAQAVQLELATVKRELTKYYELVSEAVLRLIDILIDRSQFNISNDDTIEDIISLLNKKTMFSGNPQNQLFRDFMLVLKSLESIKDQINVKLSMNYSNHIEIDIQRERFYRQISETSEAADKARIDFQNAPKLPMLESSKSKTSLYQSTDTVELNPVPLKRMTSSKARNRIVDSSDKLLSDVALIRGKSELNSPSKSGENLEEYLGKKIGTSQFAAKSGRSLHSNSNGSADKDYQGNTESLNDPQLKSESLASSSVLKTSGTKLISLRSNRVQTETPDNIELEEMYLLKRVAQGFISYEEDPDSEQYQKFPLIAVNENNPVSFVVFALNCSTYMKEIYQKNEFKEIEKLVQNDQLLQVHGPNLKIKLYSSEETPLTIKSNAQEIRLKAISGTVDSLVRELKPPDPTKNGGNVPNFDLINDITGLIDLGLPPPIKNPTVEKIVFPEFKVSIYYPLQFQVLRLLHGISHVDFIKSLAKSFEFAEISGGKSNASFIKSHDSVYILKGMKKYEFKMLTSMIFNYFKYMWEARTGEHPSLLAKIYGMYEISVKDGEKYNYILMENLFYDMNPTRIYDLKGSESHRYIVHPKPGKTLLDTNFKIDQNGEPICLELTKSREVFQALQKDAEFLTQMNRIDYSLLLILDDENRVCKMGIIDYLREYTFDKQLESVGKMVISRATPTIIKSSAYKERFLSSLQKIFMEVEIRKEKEANNAQEQKIEEFK